MLGHPIVYPCKFFIALCERTLPAFRPSYEVVSISTQFSQRGGMFVFKGGSLFQKSGKILLAVSLSWQNWSTERTLVELMLCFNRLSKVVMPIYPVYQ
jgi:hypothetical protein